MMSSRALSAEMEIRDFEPSYLDELVPMWRASFEEGVGIIDPNPIEGQRQYFLDQVLPTNVVRVAVYEGQLIGFVAANRESVSQLYVRRGFQRVGVGTRMLEWAKAQSGGSLWLYTFAQNRRARAFYERHGFVAIEYGFEKQWQLEDVKYRWESPPAYTARTLEGRHRRR